MDFLPLIHEERHQQFVPANQDRIHLEYIGKRG
jgi:hypothetical protein